MTSLAYRLKTKHADLDRLIAAERGRSLPDSLVLQTLKRRKLRLKEQMAALRSPLAA